jgi:PiT family inorganic phosphate transporter
MGQVVMSWVVSPVMGGLFSYCIFRFILWRIFSRRNPLAHAKATLPYMVFALFMILTNAMVYKGLKNLKLDMQFGEALLLSAFVGGIAFIVAKALARKIPDQSGEDLKKQFSATENIFKYLHVITAFYIAFAHGSNDVANAVGPLAAAVSILREGTVHMKVEMPLWILGLGGICIVFGLVIWGSKVMETIGEKITEITPSRGFAATFGAATVVLICSKYGLPISTTHTLVGSVIGVGLARGLSSLDLSIVKTIIISWFATVPFTMVLSMIIFKCFILFLP